jgi:hypothetical protein
MVRSQPEDEVLQLDETIAESGSHLVDLTTWDALLSPAFWVFAVSSDLFGLVHSGISLFNQSILELRGLMRPHTTTVLVISTLFGLIANFAGGWLASRLVNPEADGSGHGRARRCTYGAAARTDLQPSCPLRHCHGHFGRSSNGGVLLGVGAGLRQKHLGRIQVAPRC